MSTLTDAQLATLQGLLDEREATLRDSVREAKSHDPNPPGVQVSEGEDLVEEGDTRFRTGIEHVELMRDQEELSAISAARERIADGSYGECVECGAPIGYDRLQAQPSAKRCLTCQEAYERHHESTPRYTS